MNRRVKIEATVVKHTGSLYLVSELPLWNPIEAVLRGRLRMEGIKNTNPVTVGDRVEVAIESDGGGVITKLHPRTNYIIRRSTNLSKQTHIIAANIDQALLIVTLHSPEVKLEFIDRFLVTAQAYRVPVKIILNKCDLLKDEHKSLKEQFYNIYQKSAGYEIIECSTLTGFNIEKIRELCKDSLSLFLGVSGVGKSSLINRLDPSLSLKVSEISQYHKQGVHTTTFYEIHPIESGGFIIDSPGIRGFGLVEMEPEELSHYFPEMLKVLDGCRFSPCTHTHEPECAVKEELKQGGITYERYLSYINMMEEEEKYR